MTRRKAHDTTRRNRTRKRRARTARTQRPSGWPGNGGCIGGEGERTARQGHQGQHWSPLSTGASMTRRKAHGTTRRDRTRKRRARTARTQRPSGWPGNGGCIGGEGERTARQGHQGQHWSPLSIGASMTRRKAHGTTRRDRTRKKRAHTARTQRPSGWPGNGRCIGGEGERTGRQRHQRQHWSPLSTSQR